MRGHREERPKALHAALQNSARRFINVDFRAFLLNTDIHRSDTGIT